MYCCSKSGDMLRGMDTKIDALTFGKRLKAARLRAGMTQPDALKALKEKGFSLTQPGLSHYERGIRSPDPDFIAAAAEVVGTSVDYLTGLTKTQAPVAEIEEALAAASGAGKINKIMDRLPKDKQQQVLTFAEFLLSQEKKSKPVSEFDEWVSATEVLVRRQGAKGEKSFTDFLLAERPDLAGILGITAKKRAIQNR